MASRNGTTEKSKITSTIIIIIVVMGAFVGLLSWQNILLTYSNSDLLVELYMVKDTLDSYAMFPNAINRTLTNFEISQTGSAVNYAVSGTHDLWEAERGVYNYITSNIRYENDIFMPYINKISQNNVGITYIQNYVEKPGLTIQNGYGDCEDQAILAYAMIKYFERNIQGPESDLYLANIIFRDNDVHVCVIQPRIGGYAFILDPAGKYLTPNFGDTNARNALNELTAYSNYWIMHGGVSEITLYRVINNEGDYIIIGKGTVSYIASLFI